MKNIRVLLVFLLFALFASIFSLQKISLNYSEPFFLIGFRMTFAGLIMVFYTFKKQIVKINFIDIKFFIYLAIFNIYLNSIFEIWGLNNMSSSKACMIYSISPFLTAIIAFFFLKEKITKKKIIGLIIGISGLVPIINFKTTEELNINNILIFSMSEISLILSVIFSVLGWISLKKIITLGHSYITANSISMLFGGLLIILQSYLSGEIWNPLPITDYKNFFYYTFLTCIISNIICYNLFGYLLKYFSTTFMTFAGLITPFFASLFGFMFLKETITINFFISITIFLLGLLIFYKEEI
ncbi:MAG TPA: DMT family transporter [Candidatus Azoamicus sp.]